MVKVSLDILNYYDKRIKEYIDDHAVSEEELYKGADGSGTMENPAEGTLLKSGQLNKTDIQEMIENSLELKVV